MPHTSSVPLPATPPCTLLFSPPLPLSRPHHAAPPQITLPPRRARLVVRPPPLARNPTQPLPVIFAQSRPTSPPNPLPPDDATLLVSPSDAPAHGSPGKHRNLSSETREKISYALLGRPKSEEMRAKVSAAMKGRPPWNKGKKLSPETRARMSQAHTGLKAWNKGRRLTRAHREAISASSSASPRSLSSETRRRMRVAQRRPSDGLVSGSAGHKLDHGTYSLVDGSEINEYVSLRRELRVWSDRFISQNGRRPTLADVRRLAPVPVMRKFEKYVAMRDRIRGLANDVCGAVDSSKSERKSSSTSESRWMQDSQPNIVVTKHGNRRLLNRSDSPNAGETWHDANDANLIGALDDMWDAYDRPASASGEVSESTAAANSLIGAHEIERGTEQLSPNDYRNIGRHRLMETMDINHYVRLRKELREWSSAFKNEHGRTPSVSDAKTSGGSSLYLKVSTFMAIREKMNGLVREVYGTEVDDVETLSKVSAEGREALRTLRERCDDEKKVGAEDSSWGSGL